VRVRDAPFHLVRLLAYKVPDFLRVAVTVQQQAVRRKAVAPGPEYEKARKNLARISLAVPVTL